MPDSNALLRRIRELVDDGRAVALEPRTAVEAGGLIAVAAEAARSCRLTVPVAQVSDAELRDLAGRAAHAGVGIDLTGPVARVVAHAAALPRVGAIVPVVDPGAEDACRALTGARVRLVGRSRWRSAAADLAFVRCLNVSMAAGGHLGVATTDPRLIAIAGERAAWNGRSAESWEYVVTTDARAAGRRRVLATGQPVRVALGTEGSR